MASNRAEFLRSLENERNQTDTSAEATSSCARTDAKAIDRNAQIKYDIAKNEDGPLRRTMRNRVSSGSTETAAGAVPSASSPSTTKGKAKTLSALPKVKTAESVVVDDVSSDRHPGLDERLTNIESHLSVRYGMSIPFKNGTDSRPSDSTSCTSEFAGSLAVP